MNKKIYKSPASGLPCDEAEGVAQFAVLALMVANAAQRQAAQALRNNPISCPKRSMLETQVAAGEGNIVAFGSVCPDSSAVCLGAMCSLRLAHAVMDRFARPAAHKSASPEGPG